MFLNGSTNILRLSLKWVYWLPFEKGWSGHLQTLSASLRWNPARKREERSCGRFSSLWPNCLGRSISWLLVKLLNQFCLNRIFRNLIYPLVKYIHKIVKVSAREIANIKFLVHSKHVFAISNLFWQSGNHFTIGTSPFVFATIRPQVNSFSFFAGANQFSFAMLSRQLLTMHLSSSWSEIKEGFQSLR